MNRRNLVLSVLTIGTAGFVGGKWYVSRSTPTAISVPVESGFSDALVRPHSPIIGAVDARVTIVEFFDPACEACRAFYPIVKDIIAQHPDDVRVVIRYTPFHGPVSEASIKILEAARLQGKFEPVLQALLANQRSWAAHGAPDSAKIGNIAAGAGLDLELAMQQVQSPEIVAVFNQDLSDVKRVGVRQTPTFFVNGKPLNPFGADELRDLVASEVAALDS